MHSLLLLLDLVPELLVEPGQISRSIDPAAIVPLACRQPRSAHRRPARSARRSVPALSLSYHHELHQDLPERTQPGSGDWPHQGNDGGAWVRTASVGHNHQPRHHHGRATRMIRAEPITHDEGKIGQVAATPTKRASITRVRLTPENSWRSALIRSRVYRPAYLERSEWRRRWIFSPIMI
jgi:hypothetical protein